jgi:transposase-like protein
MMICPTCGCQNLVKCGDNGYRKKYKCKACGAMRANGDWFPIVEARRNFIKEEREKKKEKVRELYTLGRKRRYIANECGVCWATVYDWTKSIKKPTKNLVR